MKYLIVYLSLSFLLSCNQTNTNNEDITSVPIKLEPSQTEDFNTDFYLSIDDIAYGPAFQSDSNQLEYKYRIVITTFDDIYTIYRETVEFSADMMDIKLLSQEPITHFLSQVSKSERINKVDITKWNDYRTIILSINSNCYILDVETLELAEC
jgi:hypothetical protein